MKAIRVHRAGAPDVMKIEDVADPQPGSGEVVVKVHAAGVNPVDTYTRSGSYPVASGFPYTPGMDAAGVVQSVGEGVNRLKAGDRVYVARSISGTYAEKVLCREPQVQPLPDNISFAQGAGVYVPYATAWRALFQKVHAKPGDTVLVHGASGGVGIAAVQIARGAGMRVIGTGGTARGRDLVLKEGAHHVLDHSDADYTKMAMELTGGGGFDVILEMLANVNLERDLQMIAMGGRIMVIGNRGRIEIDPRLTMGREASIIGMVLMNATDEELVPVHAAIVAGLENGTLRPVVGQEMPLADAPRAHEAVMQPGAYGKIVLIP